MPLLNPYYNFVLSNHLRLWYRHWLYIRQVFFTRVPKFTKNRELLWYQLCRHTHRLSKVQSVPQLPPKLASWKFSVLVKTPWKRLTLGINNFMKLVKFIILKRYLPEGQWVKCVLIFAHIYNCCIICALWMGGSHIYEAGLSNPLYSASWLRSIKRSSLIQIMACRLLGAEPLPEPIMNYCKWGLWNKL